MSTPLWRHPFNCPGQDEAKIITFHRFSAPFYLALRVNNLKMVKVKAPANIIAFVPKVQNFKRNETIIEANKHVIPIPICY